MIKDYKWYITLEDYKLAESNGISNKNLINRVRNHGWQMKRACTEPLKHKWTVDNLTMDIFQNLNNNNISVKVFRQRVLHHKWSVKDAMTIPPTIRNYG